MAQADADLDEMDDCYSFNHFVRPNRVHLNQLWLVRKEGKLVFHKNLSELGWEKVKTRQLHRLPLAFEWIDLIQMKPGHSVLDIGPGPGVFTQHYTKVVGSTGKVTALEKSEEAIAYLKEELIQAESTTEILEGDAENVALYDQDPFDIVMLTDVLHHADSPAKCCKTSITIFIQEVPAF